jgi:hypothetical protein
MNQIKTEHEILQSIIDADGDCINISLCLGCPFAAKCVDKAITRARRLLPKQTRVRLAYERLFNELMENELNEQN